MRIYRLLVCILVINIVISDYLKNSIDFPTNDQEYLENDYKYIASIPPLVKQKKEKRFHKQQSLSTNNTLD